MTEAERKILDTDPGYEAWLRCVERVREAAEDDEWCERMAAIDIDKLGV